MQKRSQILEQRRGLVATLVGRAAHSAQAIEQRPTRVRHHIHQRLGLADRLPHRGLRGLRLHLRHRGHHLGIVGRVQGRQGNLRCSRRTPTCGLLSSAIALAAHPKGFHQGRSSALALAGHLLHLGHQLAHIGCAQALWCHHAEDRTRTAYGNFPVVRLGQHLLSQLYFVGQAVYLALEGPAIQHQAPVRLHRPGEDDQVLQFSRQPHGARLVYPASHPADCQRAGVPILGRLLGKVQLPVRVDLQRRLAHLAELERVDDRSKQLAQRRIRHDGPAVGCLHRGLDFGPDLANQLRADFGVEARVGWVAVRKQLVQQVLESCLEVRTHRRTRCERRIERLKLLFSRQFMHDGVAGLLAHAVGHFQMADQLDAQGIALVLGHRSGLNPIDEGQVGRVRLEALALQDVVKHHITLQVGLRLGAEEGRQPHQRLCRTALVFAQACQVIGGRSVRLVERQVEHHGPGARPVFQPVIGHLTHVLVDHLHFAARAAPVEVVVVKHRAAVGNAQLLKQQLAHGLASVAGVVHHFGSLQHRFQVHARDLDGDHRVGIVGDFELTHFTSPVAQLAQYLLRLLAGNG